jgi:hypothetical protein
MANRRTSLFAFSSSCSAPPRDNGLLDRGKGGSLNGGGKRGVGSSGLGTRKQELVWEGGTVVMRSTWRVICGSDLAWWLVMS